MTNGSTFVQGLYVMAVGMVIVFAALALVMLATMALERLFRPKPETSSEQETGEDAPAPSPVEPTTQATAEQEIAAAVGLALALRLQETERAPAAVPVRVLSLQDEPSLWAAIGKLG